MGVVVALVSLSPVSNLIAFVAGFRTYKCTARALFVFLVRTINLETKTPPD